MPWVKGLVFGEVTQDGQIIAQTRDLQVMSTPKPPDRDAAIAEGLDVDMLRRIHELRPTGSFEFMAHFGGATAMLVPWNALALLDKERMRRLLDKYYGYMPESVRAFPEWVAVMHARNTGAPTRQNDAEPSGGMAETIDLLAEQVSEMVEMGVYFGSYAKHGSGNNETTPNPSLERRGNNSISPPARGGDEEGVGGRDGRPARARVFLLKP